MLFRGAGHRIPESRCIRIPLPIGRVWTESRRFTAQAHVQGFSADMNVLRMRGRWRNADSRISIPLPGCFAPLHKCGGGRGISDGIPMRTRKSGGVSSGGIRRGEEPVDAGASASDGGGSSAGASRLRGGGIAADVSGVFRLPGMRFSPLLFQVGRGGAFSRFSLREKLRYSVCGCIVRKINNGDFL